MLSERIHTGLTPKSLPGPAINSRNVMNRATTFLNNKSTTGDSTEADFPEILLLFFGCEGNMAKSLYGNDISVCKMVSIFLTPSSMYNANGLLLENEN
jgi:hypothetical protein